MSDSQLDIEQQSKKEESAVKVCKEERLIAEHILIAPFSEAEPPENSSSSTVVKEEKHFIPILGENKPTLTPSKEQQVMSIPIVGQDKEGGGSKECNSAPQKSSAFSHVRKMFIGGLSDGTTDDSLADFYRQYGSLEDCIVMKDSITGYSRRFGFVTYAYPHEVGGVQLGHHSNRIIHIALSLLVQVERALNSLPHIVDGKQVDPKRALSREDMAKEHERQMAGTGGGGTFGSTPQWYGDNRQQSRPRGWSGTRPSYPDGQRFSRGVTPHRQTQSTPAFIGQARSGPYRQQGTPAASYGGEMKRTRMDSPAPAQTPMMHSRQWTTQASPATYANPSGGGGSMRGGGRGAHLPQQPLWTGGYGYGGYVSGAWADGGELGGDGGWSTQSTFGGQGSYTGSNTSFYDPNRGGGGGRGRGWR